MAKKLDMPTTGKYLALGAGGAFAPGLINQFAGDMLANIPMWTTALFQGVTVSTVVLTSVGVGLVDFLVYKN